MGTRNSTHIILIISILSLITKQSVSWTGHGPGLHRSETRVTELFRQWRETHGVIYNNDEETGNRFENFKRNLRYVGWRNSDRRRFSVGLNRFADLSNEEFREMYFVGLKRPVRFGQPFGSTGLCNAPLYVDWRENRAVSPVQDQGLIGSSWDDAVDNGELIRFSEQAVVDCDKNNNGCDAFINLEQSENAILCATVYRPVSVRIHGSSIDFQLYTGGIYDGECSSNPNDINHSVLIVGYNSVDGRDYWIVKNSWGSDWGMNGYMYIQRNTDLPYGVCGINAHASIPTRTYSVVSPASAPSLPPPSPPPPPPILSPPPPPPPPPPILSPSPPPPLPTPSPPPPPPPPSSHHCGANSYCKRGQTCCCLYELSGFCMINGCCDFVDGVCCSGTDYCCPRDYPVCDPDEGVCLKKSRDFLGVPARKKTMARLELHWRKNDNEEAKEERSYEPLQWRKAAML